MRITTFTQIYIIYHHSITSSVPPILTVDIARPTTPPHNHVNYVLCSPPHPAQPLLQPPPTAPRNVSAHHCSVKKYKPKIPAGWFAWNRCAVALHCNLFIVMLSLPSIVAASADMPNTLLSCPKLPGSSKLYPATHHLPFSPPSTSALNP